MWRRVVWQKSKEGTVFIFGVQDEEGGSLCLRKFSERLHMPQDGPLYKGSYFCVVSDFRLEVGEICALLCCYPAYSGNFLATFRDWLSRNVGKKLSLYAA